MKLIYIGGQIAYFITGVVLSVVIGVIWGIAVQRVIENKGYYENWFWWGFFFGFLALIVATMKPQNTYQSHSEFMEMEKSVLKQMAGNATNAEDYCLHIPGHVLAETQKSQRFNKY